MNVQVPLPARGYGIDVEPLHGRVTAYRHGAVLASSTRAKVMYETRLDPVVYFPEADLVGTPGETKDLQTFCPFKGTAAYRDLAVGEERIEDAIWHYSCQQPDSKCMEGYVAFMPGVVDELDLGSNVLRPPREGNMSGPLVDWLLREAGQIDTPDGFAGALAEKLVESGVPIARMSIMIWSLDPLIAGKNYVWSKGTNGIGKVSTFAPSYEIHDHPGYAASPLRHVSNGLGGVRQRLNDPDMPDMFPIMADLRAMGGTDYVAMPLKFSDGRINVLTLTSNHPDGFTTANLGLMFECSTVISRYFEVFMQRENAQSLLETYVGKRSGARVLGGEIRRGDGDEIDAAIMFVDLRNSTGMQAELGRRAYIGFLNEFFETVSDLVHGNGGEVLKFIGDAVLAVFPAEGGYAARAQALSTARQITERLGGLGADLSTPCEAAIGIDYGSVTWGNVGSRERLDFTVIGEPANIAARLADYAKATDHRIVVTEEVVPPGDGAHVQRLGDIELHNVGHPVSAVAIGAHPGMLGVLPAPRAIPKVGKGFCV